MTHAYDKLYRDRAQTALGRMLDFAINDLGYDGEGFLDRFLASGLAQRFGEGDFTLLAGMSGVELAYGVLEATGEPRPRKAPSFSPDRSPEYWAGWALAYYQWETGLTFSAILRAVPFSEILALYHPYHEMDIRHFCQRISQLYQRAHPEANLKLLRQQAGLSQQGLADQSGVPLRTIQQYEQRQKHINRAQAETLLRLSQPLCCRMEDLLERI